MALEIDMTRTRRSALVVAATLPVAAVLLTGNAAADPLIPEWPAIGEIASGSASGSALADPAGIENGSVGSELSLGPGSAPLWSGLPGTGSAGAVGLGTGGFDRNSVGTGSTGSSGLGPKQLGSSGVGGGTADLDSGFSGIGIPGLDQVDAVDTEDAGTGSSAVLGLDKGSVQTACTGSAVVGSTMILLGSATGSAIIGPGSSGSGLGSAAVGSAVTGSGLIGSGLIGPGSSGSGLGSAATGSAVTGSALLTCLLLIPVPAPFGLPLLLEPPTKDAPAILSIDAVTESLTALAPSIVPAPPTTGTPPRPRYEAAEPTTTDSIAWNLLQLVTILVITVLTVVRKVTSHHRRRAE